VDTARLQLQLRKAASSARVAQQQGQGQAQDAWLAASKANFASHCKRCKAAAEPWCKAFLGRMTKHWNLKV
jgi:hypothetical protein